MKKVPGIILLLGIFLLLNACATAPVSSPVALEQSVIELVVVLPTSTPTALSTTQAIPSLTLTPAATTTGVILEAPVTLTLQGDTYCRTGPSTLYPAVMILQAGDLVEVVGRYYFEHYYHVTPNGDTSNSCWIYSDSTPSGNENALPLFTAAPAPSPTITPTPTTAPADFRLGTPWFDQCEIDSVHYYIPQFEIHNIGSIHFQSIKVVLTNVTTLDTFVYEYDYFRGSKNCAIDSNGELSQLLAGDSTDVVLRGNRMLQVNPAGSEYSLKVTLYARNKQEGIAVTREIYFTP